MKVDTIVRRNKILIAFRSAQPDSDIKLASRILTCAGIISLHHIFAMQYTPANIYIFKNN